MVFNNFGAPLYESFEGHSTTSVGSSFEPTEKTLNQMQVALTEIEYDFDCADKIEHDNKVYCRRHDAQEVEAFQNNNDNCITSNDGEKFCGPKDECEGKSMSMGNNKYCLVSQGDSEETTQVTDEVEEEAEGVVKPVTEVWDKRDL